MSEHQFIVVCQQIICSPGNPVETVYGWNGERYKDRDAAIREGFKIRESDDFNIGVLDGDKLVSFDWMNEPIGEPPEVLVQIENQLFGLSAIAALEGKS